MGWPVTGLQIPINPAIGKAVAVECLVYCRICGATFALYPAMQNFVVTFSLTLISTT
jgi:hypothetical protein